MTDAPRQTSSFIWADRLAAGSAVAASLLWAAFWMVAYAVIGGDGGKHLWYALGVSGTEKGALAIMSLWIVLRGVDLAAGGATYRLSIQCAKVLKQALATAIHGLAKHPRHPQIAG